MKVEFDMRETRRLPCPRCPLWLHTLFFTAILLENIISTWCQKLRTRAGRNNFCHIIHQSLFMAKVGTTKSKQRTNKKLYKTNLSKKSAFQNNHSRCHILLMNKFLTKTRIRDNHIRFNTIVTVTTLYWIWLQTSCWIWIQTPCWI